MTDLDIIQVRMGSGKPFTRQQLCTMQGIADKDAACHFIDKTIRRWQRNGWIEFVLQGLEYVWALTDKGRLEALMTNAAQVDQWDAATRGQKMSSASGKVIYKYQMPVLERFTMKLPRGAEIIRMADQDGMFWLWAVVDTRAPDEDRHFVAVKCGGNVPENRKLVYRGFCAIFVQMELGLYIFEDVNHDN